MSDWNKTYTVYLGENFPVTIPLLNIGDDFHIYSFDMTGECAWNLAAAKALADKLKPFEFDGIMTVQTKSCGLAQALCALTGKPSYLELRKSRKAFMVDPVGVEVKSITTSAKQELWIGREKYERFQGKRLCFLDDVVSTGGTIRAVKQLAEKINVTITVIACALTEGGSRDQCQGIPLVALDNIPLPGKIH